MGSGGSTLDARIERRMSTISTSASASVVTERSHNAKRPLLCSVLSVRSNGKVAFASSIPGAEERDALFVSESRSKSPNNKYLVQSISDSSKTVSLSDVAGMPVSALMFPRVAFASPNNFSFSSICGHGSAIRSVSTSADGGQAAVVDDSGVCFLHETTTGAVVLTLRSQSEAVACAISKDSKFVCTLSYSTASIFDLTNGKRVRDWPHQASAVMFTDDSEFVVTTSDRNIFVWDAKTGEQVVRFEEHLSEVTAIGCSRKRQLLGSGSDNGQVLVWGYSDGRSMFSLKLSSGTIASVSFSNDGRRVSACDRATVVMWDTFTGCAVFSYSPTAIGRAPIAVTGCLFVAGNSLLVGTNALELLLLDPNNATEVLSLRCKGPATAFSGSWSGDVVLVGDRLGNVYKLHLHFGARQRLAHNMDSKPKAKESKKFD